MQKAPASGVTDHASHPGDHFLGLRRLAEKPAVVANIDGPSAGEKETLAKADGNRTASARLLGFFIRTLRNKIAEYSADGVDVPPPVMCHHPAA
jgi:Bacterial regulatory protein, Fis family